MVQRIKLFCLGFARGLSVGSTHLPAISPPKWALKTQGCCLVYERLSIPFATAAASCLQPIPSTLFSLQTVEQLSVADEIRVLLRGI
jgi:hypothetical protein